MVVTFATLEDQTGSSFWQTSEVRDDVYVTPSLPLHHTSGNERTGKKSPRATEGSCRSKSS